MSARCPPPPSPHANAHAHASTLRNNTDVLTRVIDIACGGLRAFVLVCVCVCVHACVGARMHLHVPQASVRMPQSETWQAIRHCTMLPSGSLALLVLQSH